MWNQLIFYNTQNQINHTIDVYILYALLSIMREFKGLTPLIYSIKFDFHLKLWSSVFVWFWCCIINKLFEFFVISFVPTHYLSYYLPDLLYSNLMINLFMLPSWFNSNILLVKLTVFIIYSLITIRYFKMQSYWLLY